MLLKRRLHKQLNANIIQEQLSTNFYAFSNHIDYVGTVIKYF